MEGIIIKCCSHLQEARTVSGIYHLITGKKSIQTVQDAHSYRLDQFFGIYKSLPKQDFDNIIAELISHEYLIVRGESFVIPTTAGEKWLDQNRTDLPFEYFNGLKYIETGITYSQRLLLLIQTLTNIKMNNYSFIPIIDKSSITTWVRTLYHTRIDNKNEWSHRIYEELYTLLNQLTDLEAGLFVDRLTGFQRVGMSSHQLATKYNLDVHNVYIHLVGIVHRLLDTINSDKSKFYVMSLLLEDMTDNVFITNSAKETYHLLNQNLSIYEIAAYRKLKVNTIYDHVIEIALNDEHFPKHNYVNEDEEQDIINAIKQTNSFKLKDIKHIIDANISYFQIRLVIAMAKLSIKTGEEYEEKQST
ncbi:helix-turn-helix domain-containing protein [Virgibacillus byunsanensis]|uniref:Helix-turn-helix domain-containing protein n=1 Tax=Virgibacillus byunsanensis TaxID=570945 RepID=A0ABW3LNH8_9BACI